MNIVCYYNFNKSKNKLVLFILLLIMISASVKSFAVLPEEVESKFKCSTLGGDDSGECIYVAERTTNTDQIVSNVRTRLFDGFSPDRGYIEVLNGTAIRFWYPDSTILEKMKVAIYESDRQPTFVSNAGGVIDVQIDVFAIEETAFDNLLYELKSTYTKGPALSASNERVSSGLTDAGSYLINLVFGNLTSSFFKLNLDFSRISSWSTSVNAESFSYHNNETISFNDAIGRFTDDGNYNREKADIGTSINGTIIQDANDKNKIRISNLSVSYGLATNDKNSLARKITLYNKTVDMIAGVPFILSSSSVSLNKNSTQGNFIFSQGNSSESVQSKIVIVLTAWPRQDHASSQRNGSYLGRMTQDEVSKLPEGTKQSTNKIIRSLMSYVVEGSLADSFGQVVQMQLDKNELTKSNYSTKVNVEIYSLLNNKPKLVKSDIVDIQKMVLMPLVLPPIDVRQSCQDVDSCKVIDYIVKISTDKRFLKRNDIYNETYYKLQYLPKNYEVNQSILSSNEGQKLIKPSFINRIFGSK